MKLITATTSPAAYVASPATLSPADQSAALRADDSWGDIVGELSSIRPTHRSRKSQVADFLLRRNKPDISADALGTATRAHTSRFFKEALKHHARSQRHDDGHPPANGAPQQPAAPMTELVAAIKSAKGAPGGSFDRAKAFAARHTDDVAQLLSNGGDEFQQELQVELLRSGMGGTKARKCTEVVYAALVAQFATDNETERRLYLESRIDALDSPAHTLASRLAALNRIDAELACETRLSSAGIALIKARLAELRPLLEQSTLQHEMMIASATKDISVDMPAQHIEGRLRELDDRAVAITNSTHLSDATREHLQGLLRASRTLLMVLGTRSGHLEALVSQPRLQGALQSLGAREYVKVQLGLTHAIDHIAPAYQNALLERLDELILGAREAGWIVAMHQGDADITDMVLAGAQWDEQAWKLKLAALSLAQKEPAREGLALLNLGAQHARRIAARELDQAMQSAALKTSVFKAPGNRGKDAYDKFPVNAFQALKADAALIAWFAGHAPQMVGERDLAIANWIKLSLHNPATGLPDSCDALFAQLRSSGIATDALEIQVRQGFKSTRDVQACMNQIQAFSVALQKNALVASVDPQVRAAQIGMQLLLSIGIRAEHIGDPAIDAQARQLIARALQQRSGAKELLQTLRRVAVIQVAAQSQDPNFSTSGENAAGPYSSQIMTRLVGLGLDLGSPHPLVKETATHLRQKLPGDDRPLEKLCSDFDPAKATNRARALVKSAVGARPFSRAAADSKPAASLPVTKAVGSPVAARRAANEATLRSAVTGLQPNEIITITFGDSLDLKVSAPVVPGLALAASLTAGRHNSIQMSRAENGGFVVEVLGGVSARQGVSITTVMDALELSVGVTQAREKGHRIKFAAPSDCEAFLVAVANGSDPAPTLKKASSVEAATRTALAGEVAATATADFTIASLSVAVAATAGERHSVHQNNLFRQEVFSRDVSAQVVVSAALAADLASGQAGAKIDLGVRRSIVRESGMLAGGPAGSDKAGLSPALSMVARVTKTGNTERCLNTLLPGASPAQRQAITAQLGVVEEGTELFTRYLLNETARVQANVLLGKAASALTQAAMQRPGPAQQALREQAMSFVKQADAVTRNVANYAPEGFGWTLRSDNAVGTPRGAYSQSAQRAGEQTSFIEFDATADGSPPVGQSLLLAATT
ncbi:MAG: hypothetical protein H7332_12950 [Bdellovibrionales bacterium]|nr:hypothetical protein [Ramlibacter sp.]